jgi:hypothetical protein
MEYFFGSFGLVGVLFMLLVAALWALLPFAVFGIKNRLDRQIELLQQIEHNLRHNRDDR